MFGPKAGQVCSAGSRYKVHRCCYREAVEKVKAITERSCLDPTGVMGPVSSHTQCNSILTESVSRLPTIRMSDQNCSPETAIGRSPDIATAPPFPQGN
ncbi:MAG: aldehyde dehydrogenase family protein [Candidatus Thiodiazotropha sp. (ex Ustalcina ferruginea)]|nr:aldehyde dehydrogenase family protein [Candidatus Thiodiazotropha sp. (ex Ustalcina ferruginea)]